MTCPFSPNFRIVIAQLLSEPRVDSLVLLATTTINLGIFFGCNCKVMDEWMGHLHKRSHSWNCSTQIVTPTSCDPVPKWWSFSSHSVARVTTDNSLTRLRGVHFSALLLNDYSWRGQSFTLSKIHCRVQKGQKWVLLSCSNSLFS